MSISYYGFLQYLKNNSSVTDEYWKVVDSDEEAEHFSDLFNDHIFIGNIYNVIYNILTVFKNDAMSYSMSYLIDTISNEFPEFTLNKHKVLSEEEDFDGDTNIDVTSDEFNNLLKLHYSNEHDSIYRTLIDNFECYGFVIKAIKAL
jgi:hypothetical protein